MPLLIALIKREEWSEGVQSLVALALCFIAAFATEWIAGTLTATNLAGAIIAVYGTAVVTYKAFWKPTGIAPAFSRLTQ
jgi:hypothetical protein